MRARTGSIVRTAAFGSVLALALLAAPAARADDDDEYDEYDDGYSDESYDNDGEWVTDSDQARVVGVPHYESLDGYGGWRYAPTFGTYLWFPWVDASWEPYYFGHWIDTRFGMTWVSYDPWGEVTFHYGRWVYLDPWGWGWLPGWEYSPAWVNWCVADGYVGWAPCAPAGYRYPRYHRYTPGVSVSFYGYSGSYGYDDSGLDFSYWIFVGNRDFCGEPVYRHAAGRATSLSLFKAKRVLPVGPRLDVHYVQRISPQKISTVHLDRVQRRVGSHRISVYRPHGQDKYIQSGRQAATRRYEKPARGHRVPSRMRQADEVHRRHGNAQRQQRHEPPAKRKPVKKEPPRKQHHGGGRH